MSGGGYSLSGTYKDGVVQGEVTCPSGSAAFVAMVGDASAVDRYCGTYTDAGGATGAFSFVVSGGRGARGR